MKNYVTQENLQEKTKGWLKSIAPYNRHKLELNRDKSALLVVDMQNYFLTEDSPAFTCGGKAILPNVKKLIESFRSANKPVIYTCHVHNPNLSDAGIMEWWWKG
ncbi:MAG: isochorismatase family protein, partial [Bacteroidota bacterium]